MLNGRIWANHSNLNILANAIRGYMDYHIEDNKTEKSSINTIYNNYYFSINNSVSHRCISSCFIYIKVVIIKLS